MIAARGRPSGRYDDVTDYERLCPSCHRTYDAYRRRVTGENTIPGRWRDCA